jgi:hypothetical protein
LPPGYRGCESDHSLPNSADVKNGWIYTSTPPVYRQGVHLCFRLYPYCRQHDNRSSFHANSPQCSVSFAPRCDITSHRCHMPIDQRGKYDEEILRQGFISHNVMWFPNSDYWDMYFVSTVTHNSDSKI